MQELTDCVLFHEFISFQVNYVNFSDAEVLKRGYGPGAVIEILKVTS